MMDANGYREFRPFVAECTKVGIGRSKAYELASDGLLETVTIGKKRFVYLDSLYSLPARIGVASGRGKTHPSASASGGVQ